MLIYLIVYLFIGKLLIDFILLFKLLCGCVEGRPGVFSLLELLVLLILLKEAHIKPWYRLPWFLRLVPGGFLDLSIVKEASEGSLVLFVIIFLFLLLQLLHPAIELFVFLLNILFELLVVLSEHVNHSVEPALFLIFPFDFYLLLLFQCLYLLFVLLGYCL